MIWILFYINRNRIPKSKEWRKCIDALAGLEQVPIPRRRFPATKADCDYEFYVFAGNSKDIPAAAFYLRSFNDNECFVSLVAAKMARGSIPCKELIALDIGSRLLTECTNAAPFRSRVVNCGLTHKLSKGGVHLILVNCEYLNATELTQF